MNCYVHPDRESVATCTSCGRPICRECAIEVNDRIVCRQCLSTGKVRSSPSIGRVSKDRSIALILEILPGLFGFLGFGWIYSGNTNTGVIWLVSVLAWDLVAAFIVVLTAGIGACFTIPVNIVLVAISASSLNNFTKQHRELFGER